VDKVKIGKITSRQLVIIVILLCLLLDIMIMFFLIWPQYRGMVSEISNLRDLEERYRNNVKVAKELVKLAGKSYETEAELQKTVIQLPESDDVASLMSEMSVLMTDSGLELTSVSPELPAELEEYYNINVNTNMSGTYFNLLDFLYKLENMPRVIRVKQVIISSGESGFPELNITVKFSSYFKPITQYEKNS
jgi:type IV pilus assembly protein PilO